MDVTPFDYFCSLYVMEQMHIIGEIDPILVGRVKNLRQVLDVADIDERNYQEASILWWRIPQEMRNIAIQRFNVWIGNEGIVPVVPVVPVPNEIDSEEKKQEQAQAHVYIKYNPLKKRNIVSPVYISEEYNILSRNGEYTDVHMRDINSVISSIRRLMAEGSFNIIWDNIPKNYGDKDSGYAGLNRLFPDIPYSCIKKFKESFSIATFAIYHVVMLSGIYNNYPTFTEHKDVSAHIVLRGLEYYVSVIKNPQIIIPLIEFNRYHEAWRLFKSIL